VLADDDGATDGGALDDGAFRDADAARDFRLAIDGALVAGDEPIVEHRVVGEEKVVLLARVEPPRFEARKAHALAEVDELADGVGDLELATRGGANLRDGVEDRRAK